MECRLDGITVFYEIVGEGTPIVMLPPTGLDHTSMVADMERHFAQRDGWRRIYLDWPGTGHTTGGESVATSDDMLEVVERFTDAVLGQEPFAIAGDSYGGYIARGLIYRRASQVVGALFNAPGIGSEPQDGDLPVRVVLAEDQGVLAQLRTLKEGGWIEAAAVVHTPALLDYARSLESTPDIDEALWERVGRAHALSFDADALPQPFKAPALFILGRQDHWVGYRRAWHLLENYPRATFAVLDRAGHLASLEQPELYCALVSEWLDRVQEWMQTTSSRRVETSDRQA